MIYEALPFTSTVKKWGEEIYFETPVDVDSEPTPTPWLAALLFMCVMGIGLWLGLSLIGAGLTDPSENEMWYTWNLLDKKPPK